MNTDDTFLRICSLFNIDQLVLEDHRAFERGISIRAAAWDMAEYHCRAIREGKNVLIRAFNLLSCCPWKNR
jgi:hypothetical protein